MNNNWKNIGSYIQEYTKGITPRYVNKSDTLVLNQKCIRNNQIDYSFAQYVDDSQNIRDDKYLAVGDILINSTGQGTAGRIAFVDYLPENNKVIVDSHILIIRCKNIVTANLIRYALFSFEKTLMTFIDGSSGQGEFDRFRLFGVQISLPTNNKKNVVEILSALDKKIEINNKIIKELETMSKELYDYWFVQFDFPDANGKPYRTSGGAMTYNPTLKREIPEGWEVKKLSEIANVTMGQSPCGESYNENKQGDIFYQGCTDFGRIFPTVRQYTTSPSRMAKKGDILVSVRAPVGKINFANTDCCIGRGLCAMDSKNNSTAYLYQVVCKLENVFNQRNTDGTTFGSITKDDLFSLPVLRTNDNIENSYEKISKDNLAKIFSVANENQELTTLRDWLLPMLMNGQVTISTEQKPSKKS